MAQRIILISDLGGNEIADDAQVEIRVLEYPGLSQPVKLDASQAEADRLKLEGKPMALLELVSSDGSVERVAIDAAQFGKSIKGDTDEVLARAEGLRFSVPEPQGAPRQRRARGTAPTSDRVKIDYTSVEHAGSVKRGIVSDGEKQTVREHFDEVNENLAASGQRTLNLNDIAIVERYGLQDLAKERGIEPKAM